MDPICPTCAGYGALQHHGSQGPCPECHGRGRVKPETEPELQPSLPLASTPRPDLVALVDHLSDQVRDLSATVADSEARLRRVEHLLAPVIGGSSPTEPVPDIASPSPAAPIE